jgi:nicotinate-nucleotide pyrophosphorylase (carboxylating)
MNREYRQQQWDSDVEDDCRQLVRLAVREDLDCGQDWTTLALVDPDRRGAASITPRQTGVICGLQAAATTLAEMESSLTIQPRAKDGDAATPGLPVAVIEGSVRDMLTCERIVLNLVGRMSGIASLTKQYVEAAREGGAARVYDTRKTTPGWRRLEKFAVVCGGGVNHRLGLFDGILIKDNHLACGGSAVQGDVWNTGEAVERARELLDELGRGAGSNDPMMLEIEVDTLDQLRDALSAGPDIILLDNMSTAMLREAVSIRDACGRAELEASGGVTLDTIGAISTTGVERISVGALTHSAVSLDVGLDWKL